MTTKPGSPLIRLILIAAVGFSTAAIAEPATAQTAGRALGFDTANFDKSVRPQDDFFRYVNGGWLKKTAIPADAASWGSFNVLNERSLEAMRALLEEAARGNAPAGSEQRKVGDLYSSFMDSARIESLGIAPLKAELATIAAITSTSQLPAAFAHFARVGVPRPIGVVVGPDQKQSSVNIVAIGQAGLGLPDRDYYLSSDARML